MSQIWDVRTDILKWQNQYSGMKGDIARPTSRCLIGLFGLVLSCDRNK